MSARSISKIRRCSCTVSIALSVGLAACGQTGSSSAAGSSTRASTTGATGEQTASAAETGMLPDGPNGRTVKDLGDLGDLGILPKRLSLAQSGNFVVLSSSTLFRAENDPESGSNTDFWKLDMTTSKTTDLKSITGYAVGMATGTKRVLIAMSRCTGPIANERGCFATLSVPSLVFANMPGAGPAGIRQLFASGTDVYIATATGPVRSPAITLTKAPLDGTTDVRAWPKVTIPAPATASLEAIAGVVSLTETTSAVLDSDGTRSFVDWSKGTVAPDGALDDSQSGSSLCGAGANSYIVSFLDSSKGLDSDVKVRPLTGADAWDTVVQPDNGTNLGADGLACAATKKGIWLLVSGQLFELDPADGHQIKRFDLRPQGAERGGGITPLLSVTDDAIVAFSNNHIFTLR